LSEALSDYTGPGLNPPAPAFRLDWTCDTPCDLRVEVLSHPGEWLRLWLPENIWRDLPSRPELARPTSQAAAHDAYAALAMTDPTWQRTPWQRTADGAFERRLAFSEGRVSARARPVGNEILLDIAVTNESSRAWLDCWAEVCLSLAPSSSFADPDRTRTLGRVDGRWTVMSSTPAAKPNPDHNTYHATPAVEFIERCARDWWCEEFRVQLDHPLIAVANRDDTAVIGIVFERCAEHCNNLEPDYACIHSDPLLGELEPGATSPAQGWIVYVVGSARAFVARAPAIRA